MTEPSNHSAGHTPTPGPEAGRRTFLSWVAAGLGGVATLAVAVPWLMGGDDETSDEVFSAWMTDDDGAGRISAARIIFGDGRDPFELRWHGDRLSTAEADLRRLLRLLSCVFLLG